MLSLLGLHFMLVSKLALPLCCWLGFAAFRSVLANPAFFCLPMAI
jgi:hypothetical protein